MLKGWWTKVFTTLIILEVMRGSAQVSCQHHELTKPVNLSCVFCEFICPSWTDENLKSIFECDVCYKRVVRYARLGRGGPPNNKSVHRGCMTFEEVRERSWEIGSCQYTISPGDDATNHFQCLCNDRDDCNSVEGLLPLRPEYFFALIMIIQLNPLINIL